ncbi:MAG: choice-of-anchor tandem repeat GloVer-containing protein [Chthoniobacterales bacterium]
MKKILWLGILVSLLLDTVSAQTFSSIHSFTGTDGSYPYAGLVMQKGLLYGTTDEGGPAGARGVIYSVNPQGVVSVVAGFTAETGIFSEGGLTLAEDGSLYGTAVYGGVRNAGTLFKITGNGLSVRYHFNNRTGPGPYSLVSGPAGNFYGTTSSGGKNGYGTVFRTNPASSRVTTIHDFQSDDGSLPYGRLVLARDGNFYGTSYYGGSDGKGTFYRITPEGTFTLLHSFTGSEGANPSSGVIQGNDGAFYGTTQGGGSQSLGAIYKADDQGNITVLHSFNYTDGANPQASLIQVQSGELYGTSSQGGTFGDGTIFKITTGGAYTKLYDFTGGIDGKIPFSGLTQAPDGTIYGTTNQGGTADLGTVFKLTF